MSKQDSGASFDYELDAKDPNKGLWVILGLIVLIIGAFVFLRTTPSNIGSAGELSTLLTNGQPKVLEFYSNF